VKRVTDEDQAMKINVSALVDGELEHHEVEATLSALSRGRESRALWSDAQLIGSVLRNEGREAFDISSRVMSALELEPTVLAPKPRRLSEWQRPAMAMAASAAGVALVSWLAFGSSMPEPTDRLALNQVQKTAQKPVVGSDAIQTAEAARLQEYLVAHQAYAPSGGIVGGARNIRTVAASREGRKE
jgi:sigma-E factor negative regulatory protein RseA